MFQDFGMEHLPNATSSMKRPEATPNKLLDPQENSRMKKTLSNLTQKFTMPSGLHAEGSAATASPVLFLKLDWLSL